MSGIPSYQYPFTLTPSKCLEPEDSTTGAMRGRSEWDGSKWDNSTSAEQARQLQIESSGKTQAKLKELGRTTNLEWSTPDWVTPSLPPQEQLLSSWNKQEWDGSGKEFAESTCTAEGWHALSTPALGGSSHTIWIRSANTSTRTSPRVTCSPLNHALTGTGADQTSEECKAAEDKPVTKDVANNGTANESIPYGFCLYLYRCCL